MEFIKRHWEKVLLGVVLVGLAVAVAMLPWMIASDRQQLEETQVRILSPTVKPLTPVDLTEAEAALTRARSRMTLDFSAGHRLFNPVLWQRAADGQPLKVQSGNEIGLGALQVLRTDPLYTVISFDNVLTNEAGARYLIGVERQAALRVRDRRKQQTFASVETKTDHFNLLKVQGPPENPDALIFEIAGTEGEVKVTRTEPFKRVDGYTADLKYSPENQTWSGRRAGDRLRFAGDDYNIVAINKSEVVLSAPSGKKTTVTVAP